MIVASVGHPIGFDRKIENAELFSLRHSVLKQRSERNAQGGTLMIEHSQPVYEMDGPALHAAIRHTRFARCDRHGPGARTANPVTPSGAARRGAAAAKTS
jgi:hypothetical protein